MQKISIIIPVYNTEKYIKKCLDSVINQSYENKEIIIVNDGGTDNSEQIINEYVKKFDYIKYFYKPNGGLSDCRNFGVTKATGDYLCFIDSDDYISDTLFQDLSKYIKENVDIIKYKLVKVDEEYKEIEKVNGPIFENKTGEEAFNILYAQDVMLQPAWLYLYKTTFWRENKFEYPKGMLHEDFARTALILLKARSVISTDIKGYYYYQSNSSITRGNDENQNLSRAMDMLKHYDYMIDKIKDYKIKKETEENLKIYYTNCILLKTQELNEENQKMYIKEIKKRDMLKNIKARNAKQLLKRLLLCINIKLYLKLR